MRNIYCRIWKEFSGRVSLEGGVEFFKERKTEMKRHQCVFEEGELHENSKNAQRELKSTWEALKNRTESGAKWERETEDKLERDAQEKDQKIRKKGPAIKTAQEKIRKPAAPKDKNRAGGSDVTGYKSVLGEGFPRARLHLS